MLPLLDLLMHDLRATWARWKEGTFGTGYHIWHEGLDVTVVTCLEGQERTSAVAMLQLGRSLGDDHAAEALVAMGDQPTIAAMRARLDAEDPPLVPTARVRTALLLHNIEPDPRLAAHLVAVLRSPWSRGQIDSARIDAVIGLRRFDGPDDEDALLDAVGDPCYLVRYHASESLLTRWRLARRQITDYPDIFALIRSPDDAALTEADHARLADARARLRALHQQQL